MRCLRLWFSGLCLLTLVAAVDCTPGYEGKASETCSNNKLDEGEADVDCGGKACKPCGDGHTCSAATDCDEGLLCSDDKHCRWAHCTDKATNGDETDQDCGGSCPACPGGKKCAANKDCGSTVCIAGKCTEASCNDSTKNQGESDTDCGDSAGICDRCAAGKSCTQNASCASQICKEGSCAEPSCTDNVANGTEGDIDCGGSCSTLCAKGKTCKKDADCGSNVCNATCQDAACGDTVKNGSETDMDCGGTCGGCLEAKTCLVSSDCKSGFCFEKSCRIPTCNDSIQNQGEADIDCGSPSTGCAPCSALKNCASTSDCASGVCTDSRCVAAGCSDRIKNGNEGDVDCGGGCPNRCDDKQTCLEMSDCKSGVCTGGACVTPACNDSVKNGGETDKDCGGPCSAKCALGQGCANKTDCTVNSCSGGVCGDPSCSNNAQDGTETDTDCGGNLCKPCADGNTCTQGTDCSSSRCVNKTCAAATCTDQTKNGIETDTDCGGDCQTKCDVNLGCGRNLDCVSGKCSGGKCQAPICSDSVQNDIETDTDCGGAVCVALGRACDNGRHCQIDADCRSSVCNAATGLCQAQSCTDKRKNQTETDLDCGGVCDGCITDKKCSLPSDCADRICCTAPSADGTCSAAGLCARPSCKDTVKNGLEGDVDCGVACGNTCPVGATCNNNADCVHGVCGPAGLCMAPSCTDNVRNGSETDLDCGGTCAKKCAAGLACNLNADCDTVAIPMTVCTNKICVAPGCTDGIANNTETDKDCGGPQCSPCEVGSACKLRTDCNPITSGNCRVDGGALKCVPATCSDSVKNGGETDQDCGGSDASCARCAVDKACAQGSDCLSQVCDNNVCQPPSCTDGKKNGAETALDCGGPACDAAGRTCGINLACTVDKDCNSGWCDTATQTCKVRTCSDSIKNGLESDVDCGEICGKNCAIGKGCGKDADCSNATCSECNGKCILPPASCLKQGTNCGQCPVGGACSIGFDCQSLNCNATTNRCETANVCLGQILTDADGKLPDGTAICPETNPGYGNECRAFLRCLYAKNCNPADACFTGTSSDPVTSCGQNAGIGSQTTWKSAGLAWTNSRCTYPWSAMP